MKVVITGSRNWKHRGPIEALLRGLQDIEIHVGDCPTGVDAIVLDVANTYGLSVLVHVAQWDKYNKAAGPMRNSEMLATKPSVVFAFRSEGASEGTDDCVYQANIAGIPTYIMRKLPDLSETNYMVPGINFNKKVRNHSK